MDRVRIAVDAVGGDYAPQEVVKGAIEAAKKGGVDVILVGPLERLEEELASYDWRGLSIRLHEAPQFIREGESPAAALRAKPDASVMVAARLVKRGEADAALSMGHTGATMISALWELGSIEGMERPVGGGVAFGLAPEKVVLDMGPNVDCKPRQFLQFSALGVAYSRCLLGISNPRVGLLSNGVEEGKGNQQTKEAYKLLQRSGLNFVGNVEGWDIFSDRADVIVCDGFVGNVLLKFSEGLSAALADWLKERLSALLPAEGARKVADELRGMMEVERRMGGGPLLGVKGVMIAGHGRSKAPAVEKAIQQAKIAVESRLIKTIEAEWHKVRQAIQS